MSDLVALAEFYSGPEREIRQTPIKPAPKPQRDFLEIVREQELEEAKCEK